MERRIGTYSSLNDDVPNGSVAKSGPGGRAVGIPDLGKNEALVEVDAIIGNVTGNGKNDH